MENMRIGLIGAGAIGTYILDQCNKKASYPFYVTNVFVRNREKYTELEATYAIKLHDDFEQFLQSDVDIIVEAATINAVATYVPRAIKKFDVVVISIGAFVNLDFYDEVAALAKQAKTNLYIPSGAIGGLDLIQNAQAVGTLENVTLRTRKPAHTLTDEKLATAKVIFSGPAKEAIARFPKNVNVSIALGLAGIGFSQTTVELIADPTVNKNIHAIEAEGLFGKATFTIENEALPSNPKSSYLAAISMIGTLTNISSMVKIGI